MATAAVERASATGRDGNPAMVRDRPDEIVEQRRTHLRPMSSGNTMKLWTLGLIVAGIIIIPLALRKCGRHKPAFQTDPNRLYDIEDYISDQDL